MRKDSRVIKTKCTIPEAVFRRLPGRFAIEGPLLFIGSLYRHRASLIALARLHGIGPLCFTGSLWYIGRHHVQGSLSN